MDVPPLRPRHHQPVPGAIRRTDSDVPDETLRSRRRSAALVDELAGLRPQTPSLVGSAAGSIDRMLLTIPRYAALGGTGNPYGAVYRDLLIKLPARTELVILTHEAVAPEVRAWLATAGRTARADVVEADDFLGFSVWAEDAYVVISDADGAHAFVEPAAFPRFGDALVADAVAPTAGMLLYQAPLHLQGGNVLVGDDFFFVGLDYPVLTFAEGILEAPQGDQEALLREVYARYLDAKRTFVGVGTQLPVPREEQREFRLDGEAWTELIHDGNRAGTRQPIFHIDMFVSLAGRGDDGRYRVLVGDPREAALLTGEPLQQHAMAPIFDDVARELSVRGYDVRRAPLPLVYADDPDERLRSWYFATSSNVLVHAPEGERPSVFIPTYAHGPFADVLDATDRRNAEIWEELGYSVVALGDFHPFASSLGAAHCIKKYLRRG